MPKDKADVVDFIKRKNPTKITLAIGDGANDVNMIQTAHIGVGVYGKEGSQAASYADYAVQEFRALRRLVLWHGRNFGNRVADYQCTNIFKNMTFSVVFVFYNIWAGFSGMQCFEDFYYAYYNICLTAQAMGIVMCLD